MKKTNVLNSRNFIYLTVFIYLLILSFEPTIVVASILEFTRIFVQVIPPIALAFLFMFIINIILNSKDCARHIIDRKGVWPWVIAVFTGILSSGPAYMWYALLADLRGKGVSNSLIATFLYTRAMHHFV